MNHIEIEGTNAHPGAPNNWDPARDGSCGTLPVRVTWDGNRAKTCESAWVPTPEELALLNVGGSVVLKVAGWQVPVSLHVDPPLPICVLAKNVVEATHWIRDHDEIHQDGKIGWVYAHSAGHILGRHFSRVIEVYGFEERGDASALRKVALSLIRPSASEETLMALRVEVKDER